MKIFILLLLMMGLVSSCGFLRKTKSEVVHRGTSSQSYDGSYINKLPNKESIWGLLTNKKEANPTGTVTFRTIDTKTILVSHAGEGSKSSSFLIKGRLKHGSFYFKRRRRILLCHIPLFWGYRSTSFSLKTDKKGNAWLYKYDYSFGGFIIPMAGTDGGRDFLLIKTVAPK